jgi:hypothetical protein
MLLQDGIFCKHLSGPFNLLSFNSTVSLLIFCLDDLCIADRGILKSSTTTLLEYVCVFMSSSSSLMKFGVLTMEAYKLMFVIYSFFT